MFGVTGSIGLLLLAYGTWVVSGPDSERRTSIVAGAEYERLRVVDAVAHLVSIDLTSGCITLATSDVAEDGTTAASKTIDWAKGQSMDVAINGGFFYPYDQSQAWDVYPSDGEQVTVLGPIIRPTTGAVSLGVTGATGAQDPVRAASKTEWSGHSVWADHDGVVHIGAAIGDDAVLAITGRHRLLRGGSIVAPDSEPYPRTIVAVDEPGRKMWWLVVDGKQPGYSVGLTLADAAGLLRDRGAVDAVELDGGGSSTLVIDDGGGPRVTSRPMQVRVPGRSRVVANHLGIAAADTEACEAGSGSGNTP